MESKKNVFTRVKDWWKEIDEETRGWLKVVGISAITAIIYGKKMKKIEKNATINGYVYGAMDAYKDMALQNQVQPYRVPANYHQYQNLNNTKKN